MRGAAKQSKWRKAGFLVRNVTTTRDVATTGLEVLDGKGLPIKIVDQKTGEELNELLPLTGSLNLVRRTAAAQFGYTKQVVVDVCPKPPAGKRKDIWATPPSGAHEKIGLSGRTAGVSGSTAVRRGGTRRSTSGC